MVGLPIHNHSHHVYHVNMMQPYYDLADVIFTLSEDMGREEKDRSM